MHCGHIHPSLPILIPLPLLASFFRLLVVFYHSRIQHLWMRHGAPQAPCSICGYAQTREVWLASGFGKLRTHGNFWIIFPGINSFDLLSIYVFPTKMLTVIIRRGNKLIFGSEHFKYIFLLTLIINIKLSYNVFPKSHKCKSENKNPINSATLKESWRDASVPLARFSCSNPLR